MTTSNSYKLQILEFKLSQMINSSDSRTICIIGEKNSGKTTIINSILGYGSELKSDFLAKSIVFTSSPNNYKTQTKYPDMTPASSFDRKLFDENMESDGGFIIFDDVVPIGLSVDELPELIKTAKGHNKIIIVTFQDHSLSKIGLENLDQFDFFFLGKQESMTYRQMIYEKLFEFVPSFETFVRIYQSLTQQPFNFMVLNHQENLTKISDKISDKVFWYKARI